MLTRLESSIALTDWSLLSNVLFFGDGVDEWERCFDGTKVEVGFELVVIEQFLDGNGVLLNDGGKVRLLDKCILANLRVLPAIAAGIVV